MLPQAKRLNDVKEYYFSIKLKEVRSLIDQGKPIINLGIGSPDLAPPVKVMDALKNADTHGYQSYQGLPDLRKAMSLFYKKYYGVDLGFENEVLPLMGSKEGILHISMAFLNEGDEVLIPDPGYPTYASVTKLIQAVPLTYNLKESNNWWPDFKEIENLAKIVSIEEILENKGSLNIAQFLSNVDTSNPVLSVDDAFSNWKKQSKTLEKSMNELFQILK